MPKIKIIQWSTFFRGLIGAIIGGGANAVTIMVVKPEAFNFATGWTDLWHFTLVSAVVSAALYLKQNPVPPEEVEGSDTVVPFSSQKPPTA